MYRRWLTLQLPGARLRRCLTLALLALCCVDLTGISAEPFPWHEYPEVYGKPFCSTRRYPDAQCCVGRNDSCLVPMLDTVCYCDMFCERTEPDCCPDFINNCMGGDDSVSALERASMKYSGKKMIENNCYHNGVKYQPGDGIDFNCNNCTCKYAVLQEEYNWECSQRICLVRTSVLDRVNVGAFGWRAQNYSVFWGASLADVATYRLGTEAPLFSITQVEALKVKDSDVIPTEFDARKKWPGLISEVLDQGDCAASWAFSTVGVASDRLAIHSGGRQKVALSAQQLVSCNTQGQRGCMGGHVDRAWWYMRTNGLVTDACYPYRSGKTSDTEACVVPAYKTRANRVRCASRGQSWSKVYRVTPPYRIAPIEKEIMKEILDNGPVQATMQVEEDFYLYQGGVYQDSMPAKMLPPNKRKAGFHSVKIIGWGTDTSSGRPLNYWLCANSWGRQWGEDGYFRIVRGVNEGGIESFVLGVWAAVRQRRGTSAANFIYTPTPGRSRMKRETGSTHAHKLYFQDESDRLTTDLMEYLNGDVTGGHTQGKDTEGVLKMTSNKVSQPQKTENQDTEVFTQSNALQQETPDAGATVDTDSKSKSPGVSSALESKEDFVNGIQGDGIQDDEDKMENSEEESIYAYALDFIKKLYYALDDPQQQVDTKTSHDYVSTLSPDENTPRVSSHTDASHSKTGVTKITSNKESVFSSHKERLGTSYRPQSVSTRSGNQGIVTQSNVPGSKPDVLTREESHPTSSHSSPLTGGAAIKSTAQATMQKDPIGDKLVFKPSVSVESTLVSSNKPPVSVEITETVKTLATSIYESQTSQKKQLLTSDSALESNSLASEEPSKSSEEYTMSNSLSTKNDPRSALSPEAVITESNNVITKSELTTPTGEEITDDIITKDPTKESLSSIFTKNAKARTRAPPR